MSIINLPESEREALLSLFPKGVVAFDLETTGLSPLLNKIIEIGAVKITPSGFEIFDELINPNTPIPPETITIHKISDEMVKDKSSIDKLLPKFIEFLGDLPVIAHKSEFDVGFIIFNLHQLALPFPKSNIHCSHKWSKHILKGMPNYKLGTLCEKLSIELTNHHHAFDDALASLRIFAKGILKHVELHALVDLKPSYLSNFSDYQKNVELDGISFKNEIEEAIAKHLPIDILYKGGSHRNQFRPVKPLALLPMPSGNILYAECLLSREFKSFSLSKIKEVRAVSNK